MEIMRMRHYERCLLSAQHCATLRDQARTEFSRARLDREAADWRRLAEEAQRQDFLGEPRTFHYGARVEAARKLAEATA